MAMEILSWLRAQIGTLSMHDLQLDSRRVKPGDVFVALPGAIAGRSADGRSFIDAAIARGAAAVIVEADGWQARELTVPVLPVTSLPRVIGQVAARFYGLPSESLLSIGVTGTNGKTSCSQWIGQLLTLAGQRCAVIGTVGSGFPGELQADATLTTPDAISLQRAVRRFAAEGARALAMEVSSIGLDQGRVNGMKFDVALFTNLTRDHLDYHGTMARYEAAKAILFDWPTLTDAVINLDDAAGQRLVQRLDRRARAGAIRITGFTTRGATAPAAVTRLLTGDDVRATPDGLAFAIRGNDSAHAVSVPLVGDFNVSNLLGVVGCLLACGIELDRVCALLPQLLPPPGRMQRFGGHGAPLVVIDYAHTPDAIEKALAALRPMAEARRGRIWIVFGAGGDRDPGKRAPMASAASVGADRLIITSDNPRTEEPVQIIRAIAAGVAPGKPHEQIVDRALAIAHAVQRAASEDIVLIAGKGHEDYQDIGGVRRPFSDVDEARAALARRRGTNGIAERRAASADSSPNGGLPLFFLRAPC
jgi:UDP-N-acetylmuramoyl-L-alanyl-D-glutamate--2,6-diaminopimelate ligase